MAAKKAKRLTVEARAAGDLAPFPVPKVDRAAFRAHARGKVLWLVAFVVESPLPLKGTTRLILQEGELP